MSEGSEAAELASDGATFTQAFTSDHIAAVINENDPRVNNTGSYNQSSEASDVNHPEHGLNTGNIPDASTSTESSELTSAQDLNSFAGSEPGSNTSSTNVQTEPNSQSTNNAIPESAINTSLKVSASISQPANLPLAISNGSLPIVSTNSIVAAPQLNLPKVLPQLPLNVLPQPMGALPRPQIPAPDVWVETPAPDGKVYFYHAQTRQTQWTRPQNTTVITQDEFKKMVLTISSTLGPLPFPNVNPGGPSPGAALPPPHFNGPPGGPSPNHPPMLPRLPPPTASDPTRRNLPPLSNLPPAAE